MIKSTNDTTTNVTANTITDDSIIEVKSVREQLISKTEALDKVKDLFVLPGTDLMTVKQMAQYFEVDVETIRKCYKRNRSEIDSDGTTLKKYSEFGWGHNVPIQKGKPGSTTVEINGTTYEFNNAGTKCFSRRAILRIAMLLRDSTVAREIRTQLLNTFEAATPQQRTQAIDNEQDLITSMGIALARGSKEDLAFATKDYIDFQNRHITELEATNKALEEANSIIAHGISKWGERALVVAMIRSIAAVTCRSNFALAFNMYYKQLLYKKGINVRARKPSGKLIDGIKDDEWKAAVQVAAAMVLSYKLDIAKIVNNVNAEEIKKTIEEGAV